MLGRGTRGERNARLDPSTASLMGAAAAVHTFTATKGAHRPGTVQVLMKLVYVYGVV